MKKTFIGLLLGLSFVASLGYAQNIQDIPVSTFLGLSDTPSSYSGQAGQSVRVNVGASALEFFTPSTVSTTTWGTIIGTLSDQLDLQAILDTKLSTTTAASTYLKLDTSNDPLTNLLQIEATDGGTNTLKEVLRLSGLTSGTPANGIGGQLMLKSEDANGDAILAGRFDWVVTDVTPEGYDTDFRWYASTDGGDYLGLMLDGSEGKVKINDAYYLPNADGTATYLVKTDGSGNWGYVDPATIGVTDHNDLSGLQGGTTDEYYHLTSAEHTVVQNTSGTNTGDQDLSGYLTSATASTTYLKLDTSNDPLTGNLEISKADPELRLTDTGNSEYTRITRADTSNMATRYNRILRQPASGLTDYTATGTYTETSASGDVVVKFTGSGTFTPIGSGNVSVLVVGGGASGGGAYSSVFTAGGGGGGGDVMYNASYAVTNGTPVTVTIGSGGSGVGANSQGNNGSSSVFGTITSTGGGGGGRGNANGSNGANGGGAGGNQSGGTGTTGYNGGSSSGSRGGAGGGGDSATGSNSVSQNGGNGGTGTANSITGSSVTYGGGGGGGADRTPTEGVGGTGGGGNGGATDASPQAGTANTGGGGGGGAYQGGVNYQGGASGGSGVVIVRFTPAVSTTVEVPVWRAQDGTGALTEGILTFGYEGSEAGAGSRTTLDGQTIRLQIEGTEYYQIDNDGDFYAPDSQGIYFGSAKDWSLASDGTDFNISRNAGSGVLNIDYATTTPPTSTTTPVEWVDVKVNGVSYKMPLYQ